MKCHSGSSLSMKCVRAQWSGFRAGKPRQTYIINRGKLNNYSHSQILMLALNETLKKGIYKWKENYITFNTSCLFTSE